MEDEVQESLKFDANPLKDVTLDQPKAITSSVANLPALQAMDRSIKINANQNLKTTDFYKGFVADNTIANPFQSMVDNRINMTDYSIDANSAYQRLNSGKLTPLYENYIPGTNNEDRLARQQTTGEKWLNGLAKFGTSTLNTVVGGTIGTVYGISAAIDQGSFNAVFDNDFTQYLDDLNTKMRYELPNYYSQQEKDRSFYKNMLGDGAANFWADKVLGAAAFTVGAIVSEGIWAAATGGASLTTTAARMAARGGRVGKWATKVIGEDVAKAALKDYKGWIKKPLFNAYKKTGMLNKDAAISAARTAGALNTTRFLLTSSGYEAGVEALHYKKEAEENFYNSFYELNGRQPTVEEIADFENDLANSANAVFGGNMALLSVSNAVMFGKLFNIRSPFKGATKEINKKLFGLGVKETAKKGVFKALKPTKKQKLFTGVYSVGKPLATEGLFEEGGQGTLSTAAAHWVESKYDPKYTKDTVSVMEALSEGMAETYGTMEGWEEISIGFIIGGGASMIQGKGKPIDLKQIQEGRENNEYLVKKLNTFGQDIMVQRMMANNKIQNAIKRQAKAEKEGNTVEAELANQDLFLAEIELRHQIGEDVSEMPETYRIALENMTEEQFKEAGIQNKGDYISSVVSGYSNLVARYKKNIKYAEAITGIDSQNDNFKTVDTAQAMAYAITVGETSSTIMESALEQMRETIGADNSRALDLKTELERLTKNQRATLSRRVKTLKAQREKQEALTLKIQEVQNAPKETEGDRQSGTQLTALNEALLKTSQEISALESEISRFGEELSQEKTRRQGIDENDDLRLSVREFYTLEDLTNIDERIENINTLIESYQGHNPQLYQELVGLTNQYNQAKESFYRYNAMGNALARGDIKIKNKKMGGLLGKILAKDQYKQDEFTQAFLSDVLAARIVASTNSLESETTQENVPLNELYIPVTAERVTFLAEKLRRGEKLTKRESRLYEDNKQNVDNRIAEINKEKGDNPLQKAEQIRLEKEIQALEEEKRKLEETPQQTSEAEIEKRREEESKPVKEEIEKIQKEIDILEEDTQGSEIDSKELEDAKKERSNLRNEDGSIPDSKMHLFNKLSKKIRFLQSSLKSQIETLVDSFSQLNNLSERDIGVLKRFVEFTDYTFEEVIQQLEKRNNTIYKRPSELDYFEDNSTRADKLNETQGRVDENTNERSKLAAKELGIDLDKVYYADELDDFVQKHGSKQTIFIWNLIKNIATQLRVPTKFLLEGKGNNIAKEHNGEYSNGQVANRARILTSPDGAARIIVHELVHGVTTYIIEAVEKNQTELLKVLTKKQINAAKKLSNLLRELQTDPNTKDFYGSKNEHEILAELTHDGFVEALQNKKLNFVKEFLDYILDILGIPTNAYDEALSILKDMIETPVDYITKGFVQEGVYYSKEENSKLQELKNRLKELRQQLDKINDNSDAEYVDAVKKGEMTKEQAMQALEEIGRKNSAAYAEIDALNATKPVSGKEAKINEINKKIQDLKAQQTVPQESTKSEVDRLKEVVEKELKEYDTLQYIGQDADELVKNKPSNTDIERYRELLNKDRLAEEEFEFEELQQKLSDWRVLDSLMSGPRSLAEILSLIQQLETQVEQDETVTEVTEEYTTEIIDDSLGTGSAVVYELTQNTTGNATAKLLKGGILKLSHIKIDTLLSRLGGEYTQKKSKSDTIYTVTPEGTEGSITIIVKPTGAIEIELSDFLSLQQSLNLYIVDSGQINWTYKDIYEVSGQEFIIKESDFIDDDIAGNPYDIATGETIEFFYDAEDSFNKELNKKLEKGKISKEEFRDQVKIFIRKDGKNYGTLKGMREGATDENMLAIRDRATRAAEQGLSASVGNTQVSQVVLGSPKFVLDEANKPTELPITERGTEEVITTGYIMDNEFTLSDKTLEETVDQSFVGKLSKNQEGKKVPVVVIRKGAHLVAYPISIVMKNNSQADKLEAILTNETITPAQKIKEINDLLINTGIAPGAYNLTDLSEQEKLERIQQDLTDHKVYTTADTFADSYDKSQLKYDATIKIDLEDLNFSISSPKIRIDLENITVYESAAIKYESITDIENTLNDMSLKVDQLIMNDYVDSKGDAIENKLTDVYADDSVIKEPENHLEKMHNVRMLLEAFPLITPKFKQLMGQDNYNTLETNIKKIEFLKKQLDTKTNPEVQNKKDELEC